MWICGKVRGAVARKTKNDSRPMLDARYIIRCVGRSHLTPRGS